MNHEQQHIALSRSVQTWRLIAGCVRNSSKLRPTQRERDELLQIALDIEANLPLPPSSVEAAK